MSDSRTYNAKRNIINGIIRQYISIILAFISRTMILYLLGEQYLGLSSLFTSILTVLNLADMGLNVAVVFFLYKPIAENDTEQICAITAYLRRTYHFIGGFILAAGMVLLPVLPHLISGGYPADINIYVLYLIYLLNTVLTYWFFAYKAVIFTAIQRADIVDKVYLGVSFVTKVAQLLILVLFRDYYLFALVMCVGSLCNNLLLEYLSGKKIPQILPKGSISRDLRKSVGKKMHAIFIGKLADVARNSCDSIFLSVMLGLTVVAAYDNYMYIYNAIIGIIWMVGGAVQASIGNSIALESRQKNRQDFEKLDSMMTVLSGWCGICMCMLYQPFMGIWMNGREEMLLSDGNMILLCLYFYSVAINTIRNQYITAAGLFVEIRKWYIWETVGNVVLNLVLGYCMGVTGIILATLITVVGFNFIARTAVLFRYYFKTSALPFFKRHMWMFLVSVAAATVTWCICALVKNSGIPGFILRSGICAVIPNLVFVLVYFRTEYFHECLAMVKQIIRSR